MIFRRGLRGGHGRYENRVSRVIRAFFISFYGCTLRFYIHPLIMANGE